MRKFLALFILSCAIPLVAEAAAQLVTDKASGCRIVDEEAASDRTARWNGPCADGVAEGKGAAEFLAGDVLIRRVEASFSKGGAIGQIKITRYKNDAISTVTEFARGQGADDTVQKVSFYREGAVASIESGQWSGGRLNGACSVERYAGGRMMKSYSGNCVNGAPEGRVQLKLYAMTADSCLQPGEMIWHYEGAWKANALNGEGLIETHFCSETSDGVVHHVEMKAAGSWIGNVQDGEMLAEFAVDGGAPAKVKRAYDHGLLVSETLVDAPLAVTPAKKDDPGGKEAMCRKMPWLCNEHTFDKAPFVDPLTNNRS